MFGLEPGTQEHEGVSLAAFLAGLVLTVVAFCAIRRRSRPWKIEYDAIGWELTRAERKLHPNRARLKRLAIRILVWVPSLLAFVVLFFFPTASHLIRPGSQTLGPYRLYIPWTLAIMPMPGLPAHSSVMVWAIVDSRGGFGVTPFWRGEIFSSEMGFGSLKTDPDGSASQARYEEEKRARATQLRRKEFQLGRVALTCWQYLPTPRLPNRSAGSGLWQVDCKTPVGVKGQQFYALFRGQDTDIPAFYKVIQTIVPIT